MKMIPYISKSRKFRVLSDILPFLPFNVFEKYGFPQNIVRIKLLPESAADEEGFIFLFWFPTIH